MTSIQRYFRAAGLFWGLFFYQSILVAGSLPYEGMSLRVLSFQDSHARAVAAKLSEFEALTGAKVLLDSIASNTVAAKISTDQAAGGSYDLYTVDEPYMPQLSHFFVPVQDWPAGKLKGLERNMQAFLPAAVQGGAFKGIQYGLPASANVYMYVYRSDLFNDLKERSAFKARYGYELGPPQTTKALRDIAEFFTRPPKLYGFAPFTKVSEGTTVEAYWLLLTFGAEIFDTNGKLILDEKKAAEAFAFYRSLMKFAPPGAANWHHAERMTAYGKGVMAQIMTWPSFVAELEQPQRSLVAGKNAYGIPPVGPSGKSVSISGTWTLAIPKTTKHKELAAEFASWWTSFTFGRELVDAGMNPARRDLLLDPDLVRSHPWFPGVLRNFERAVIRPRFVDYGQFSDVISRHFSKMVSEQTNPEQTAHLMKRDLAAVLKTITY